MALHEFEFESTSGQDRIQAWVYSPPQPRAIVQIVHGLGEHSRRYLRLISAFLDAGFVIAADDHMGHGRTAALSGHWQDSGTAGTDGVIADEWALTQKVRELHPDLPLVLFGHSWGSIIARGYAAQHGEELAGLILGGVAAAQPSFEAVELAEIDAAIARDGGDAPAGAFLPTLFEGFLDRYDDVQGPTDWVAADRGVVADHASDPLNNFQAVMTLRFLRNFVGLYREVTSDAWYSSVPTDLPVAVLAGEDDPVGGFGAGPEEVGRKLREAGVEDVMVRVWAGYRHEIHNEPPIRDEVRDQLITWIQEHLPAL